MMTFRYISIYLAGLLIILHSVMPHQHMDGIMHKEKKHKSVSVDAFKDYLKLIFYNDLGEGHLKHFNQADSPNIKLYSSTTPISPFITPIPYSNTFVRGSIVSSKTILPDKDLDFLDNSFVFNISLRGPPFIS